MLFTLFLQGFRLLPHRQSVPQCIPAPLHGHLLDRWQVFLHEQETISDFLQKYS